MIWGYLWIIATIIAIIVGIITGYGIGMKILNGFAFGLVTLFVGALIFFGLNFVCFQPTEEAKLVETKEIYALKDNSYLSGHGNFIYVTVEEEDKYSYMVINKDGSYSKESISCEDVRIKEVDNTTPILEKYTYESKSSFWSEWSEDYYYFIVPKGSVTHDFNVDLE